jgi:hypothetical protein
MAHSGDLIFIGIFCGALCIPPAIIVVMMTFIMPKVTRANLIDAMLIYMVAASTLLTVVNGCALIFAIMIGSILLYRFSERQKAESKV